MSMVSIVVDCKSCEERAFVLKLLGEKVGCKECSSLNMITARVEEGMLTELRNNGVQVWDDASIRVQECGVCDIREGYVTIGDVRRSLDVEMTGRSGVGVLVGVMDTGIDFSHPDLVHSFASVSSTFSDEEGDEMGHGTFVASCIVSLAPAVRLVSVKVFDRKGEGKLSNFVLGVEECLRQGVHVINYSGGDVENRVVQDRIVNTLAERGVLFVTSAGNSGKSMVLSPASAGGSVAVGSIDNVGNKSSFSNTGRALGGVVKPDACFIGERVLAAVSGSMDFLNCGYNVMSGTSVSTAVASGVCCLGVEVMLERLQGSGVLSRQDWEYVFSQSGTFLVKNNVLGWGVLHPKDVVRVVDEVCSHG